MRPGSRFRQVSQQSKEEEMVNSIMNLDQTEFDEVEKNCQYTATGSTTPSED
jgi:hypothetical protein